LWCTATQNPTTWDIKTSLSLLKLCLRFVDGFGFETVFQDQSNVFRLEWHDAFGSVFRGMGSDAKLRLF